MPSTNEINTGNFLTVCKSTYKISKQCMYSLNLGKIILQYYFFKIVFINIINFPAQVGQLRFNRNMEDN